MSEEVKDKKTVKKKTSSKKVSKDTSKDGDKKKKRSTSSKKSSVSGSKKGESPAVSRDEPSESPLIDKDKEKTTEDHISPAFPPPSMLPPAQQPFSEFPQTRPGPEGYAARQPPSFAGFAPSPQYQQPQPSKPIPVRTCVHHNQALKYYCEACEEPTCEECHNSGPHNTELHRVATLQEAFNARYNYLGSGNYKTLLEKRDKLLAQLDKVDYRIGEIRSVSSIIERDIKTEYAGMLEKLKSAEGVKQAILQHDMAEIQKDIERIDSIFDAIDEYLQGDLRGDYVGFLIKFREMHEYIEYAITKPFKAKIDVVPNDLPRELTERRKMLEKAEQCESLLKLKDEIIWNLIQEKKKLSKMAEIDLDKAVQQEWNEWARLIEKYCEELLKYQLVCAHCGGALDELTVNSACPANSPDSKRSETKHTAEEPPLDSKGNGKHFFGKPLKQAGNQSFLAKVMVDPRALSAFNALKDGGKEKIVELRRRISEIDKDGRDEIGTAEFRDALLAIYSLDEDAVGQLIAALVNPGTKRVPYKPLFLHLEGLPKAPGQSLRYGRSLAPGMESIVEMGKSGFISGLGRGDKEDVMQKVAGNIRKRGMSKLELTKRFEKYDEAARGVVTLDAFYLTMMKLDFVVSNQEIDALAKILNPDVERTGEINYMDFVNRIL